MTIRIKRIAGAKISYELRERFFNVVHRKDTKLLQVLLPNHLFLEELLMQICKRRAASPVHIDKIRLAFPQTLLLARSFTDKENPEWIWAACEKVNEIRNHLVHRLEAPNTNEKIDQFLEVIWPQVLEAQFVDSKKAFDRMERFENGLFFLIEVLLNVIGPDPYKTPGDILYEAWKVEGEIKPPQISRSALLGKYASISEANWDLYLELAEDGTAKVEFVDRMNTKRDPITEKAIGTWEANGALVYVKYDGVTDILCYSEEISLEELGRLGGKPGLSQIQPFEEESLIRGITLWKLPHDL
jgi:hypothetical protein